MTFLHVEFFIWMLPPVIVLFYFWLTQKSPQSTPFSEAILERLHAPAITMTLRARNTLFLIAAVLLIVAMAQPVILQDEAAAGGKTDILIALDLSKKSLDAFETEKMSAINIIRLLKGENIALVGYDEQVYRIAPYTTDTDMIIGLIKGLDSDAMQRFQSDSSAVGKLNTDEGIKIIIGDPILEHNTHLSGVLNEVEKLKRSQRLYAHIPLFPYPIGLAMLLIWIALSSMSKRQSIPLASILMALCIGNLPSHAGLLDFQELSYGYRAYEQGDYLQSAEIFRRYQKEHDSAEIRYNLANALYKAGDYRKALYWYQKVHTTDRLLAQRTAYNLTLCESKIHDEHTKKRLEEGTSTEVFLDKLNQKTLKREKYEMKTRLYPM